MRKIEIPKNSFIVELNYNHGYSLKFVDSEGQSLGGEEICEHKGTNFKKLMTLKNWLSHKIWDIKQWLFWHNVHKPIGNFIKKHFDLTKTPYLGD